MTVEGATGTEVFCAYVEQVLSPTLSAGDIVVIDNLSAHKAEATGRMIEGRDAELLYLPPLNEAIKQAFETVTESDARAWFKHCGYALR